MTKINSGEELDKYLFNEFIEDDSDMETIKNKDVIKKSNVSDLKMISQDPVDLKSTVYVLEVFPELQVKSSGSPLKSAIKQEAMETDATISSNDFPSQLELSTVTISTLEAMESKVNTTKQESVNSLKVEIKEEPLESLIEIEQEKFEPTDFDAPMKLEKDDVAGSIKMEEKSQDYNELNGRLIIDEKSQSASNDNSRSASVNAQFKASWETKKINFPINCELCNEVLVDKEHFVGHMGQHSVDRLTQLKFYYQASDSVDKLLERATKQTTNEISCSICIKKYYHKDDFIRHMRNHIHCVFVCEICGKLFQISRHLRDHKLLHHKTDEKSEDTQQNQRNELEPFQCHVCKRTFPQKWCLNSHLYMHIGEDKNMEI